jgi:hypothetical protein
MTKRTPLERFRYFLRCYRRRRDWAKLPPKTRRLFKEFGLDPEAQEQREKEGIR